MTTSVRTGNDASGRAFELRVRLAAPREETDVIVETAQTATVAELVEAAERFLGEPSARSLLCERTGQVLDPRSLLGEADLRWGDRLVLVPHPVEPMPVGKSAVCELVVTSGPCAGQRWSLAVGSHKLGRGPSCDICIEDRSLSRSHLQIDVDVSTTTVTDLGSTNGAAIDGEALRPHVPRVLGDNDELELGRSLVRCHPLGQTAAYRRPHLGLVDFNRPPRVKPRVEPFEGKLPTPPSRGRTARLPIAAALLPLLAGVALYLLLDSPVMLAIAGLSPLMAIGSYLGDRRGGRTSFARGSAEFKARLQAATQELDAARAAEVIQRRAEAPDAPVLIERLRAVEPSVWERRPGDPDFLRLRLGVADLPARSHLEAPDEGDESLRDLVERELAARRHVASVPLTVDLAGAGVLGVAGESQLAAGLARWLIVQVAALHSPSDVLIVALLGERAADWEWLKWLPHLRPERVGLTAAVTIGRLDGELLLTQLRDVLAGRLAQGRRLHSEARAPTQILALIDERADVDRALVSATLTGMTDAAACAIWLGSDRRNLPAQVGAIVEIEGAPTTLTLTDVQTGVVSPPASTEALSVDIAGQTARLLAPLHDISEMARAGDIPRQVGLLELVGLSPPRADELAERWRRWHGSVRVTVGVSEDGPLTIDLDNEGPHALIAGTTGSGKSELLRTLVAAAATVAPPNQLAFLLVDYKGGAAFAPCAGFPHVVDVISDLDEHLAERVLVSLKAELKRREHTLAQHGARDHKELVRSNPDVAPPLLVIAIDEFAKLRAEVPEFVDGVVDIAQRGRSLGVHMVLAAQTLGNAFTGPIRASTNLRIALRVAEEGESEQIIGSPAAARIPSGEDHRGRAFARTGHGELREFQAAYVSGRTVRNEHRELTITPFALAGATSSSGRAGQGFDSDSDSDLTALAAAARQAQRDLELQMPEPPWLPVLSELVSLEALPYTAPAPFCVAIGMVDVPHMQRQDPLLVDLPAAGSVVVYGGGGSGKTTFLTSMALALAMTCVPDELRIYGVDAGSGRLACLEALSHCGGVIPAHDEERVDRLLRDLVRQIDRREGGGEPPAARTVVFLDDLGAFAQHYDRPGFDSPYERLQRVFAGGRAAGVHIVCSASRRGALTAALAAHVGQRFALRMPTDDDLVALGLDGKKVRGAKLPVGRGFTQEGLEFQVAAPVANECAEPFEQAVARLARTSERLATRIGRLPAHVERSALGPARTIGAIPLGLSDEDLRPASADVSEMHFLVVGPYRSGRSTALGTLAAGIRAADPNADMRLLAPRRSPLRDLELWDEIASSIESSGPLAVAAHERLEAAMSAEQTAFVFIDDGGELSQALVATQLEQLVRLGRDGPLRVIAAVETTAARGVGVGWIRELRKEGQGLLLQPDLGMDGDLLGTRLPRRVSAPFVPGRGFLVSRGSAVLIQVAD